MTQMSLSMKQNHKTENRLVIGGGWVEGRTGSLRLADATDTYKMDKQQGPTD